ncbi:hypothetical protein BST97_01765 [Nonlabens spongiae]|uniref:Major facilitator superfamily (MFS) profile domain-containing protein n=1 Tax=Nonlabens spongiae TaxID=331648 RepID=A0A1W6MH40_9FLAO|nr:hypothetical protein [Nonlabens spongiae]ARN76826.1 hypothetical protein BST97_01765 [Nonlabens spongiae]
MTDYQIIFLGFLMLWGMAVTADSPLLSTQVAQSALPEIRGAALTLVNCIGFTISIVSIQIINLMMDYIDVTLLFTFLAIGPILGLFALFYKS